MRRALLLILLCGLGALVARDDWLPEPFAQSDPAAYRQYLLYCDPLERFSAVSFVWSERSSPVFR